jgi:hypothetical protein
MKDHPEADCYNYVGEMGRSRCEVTDHKGNVHPPGTEAKYDNAFITTKEYMLRLKFYRKGLAAINEDDVEIIPEGAIEYNAR